jgi:ABC-2 type transport system ATP-binding protein
MSSIIQVKGLSKQFKDSLAVDELSFSVEEADVYGFLGQNGAGKSTTLRMLLTLIRPSSGRIEIFGMNLETHRKEILSQVGAIIERPDLYNYLSAYDNLALFAAMSGMKPSRKKFMDQLDRVGLADRAASRVKTYSLGMKQRLGLAIALVHDPKLLILDEPANGLDPQGIADIRNLILELSRHQKKTIVVSSHLLNEMELIANRMLIIDKGKKMMEGTVTELFDPSKMVVEMRTANPDHALRAISQSPWKDRLRKQQGAVFIFEIDKSSISRLNADLVQQGVEVLLMQPRHSLEDYFLSLTTPNQHVEAFAD